MSASALLLGLLNVILYCAIVIFIAFVIMWLLNFVGVTLDANVLKWGKIIVALLCAIVILSWLFSAIGGVAAGPPLLFRW